MNEFDVIIIGAGPAGATAAYILSGKGVKVGVLDKAKFPRPKICGGGVVSRALKYFPGILNDVEYFAVDKLSISEYKAGSSFQINSPSPLVYLIQREEFDFQILKKAIAKGAVFYPGKKVNHIEFQKPTITIRTGHGVFKAPVVIGADGALGFTNKLVNGNKIKKIPAVEVELDSTISADFAKFDFGVVPHGYGWVFPKTNSTSVGVVSMKPGINLKTSLKKYLTFNELCFNKKYFRGFVIPLFQPGGKINLNNLLLTGDALGLADPITFEGISAAIISGKLAAEAIINSPNPKEAINKYKSKIQNKLLKELRYANLLASIVYQTPRLRAFLIKNYGVKLATLIAKITKEETTYEAEIKKIKNYFKLLKYWRGKNGQRA